MSGAGVWINWIYINFNGEKIIWFTIRVKEQMKFVTRGTTVF